MPFLRCRNPATPSPPPPELLLSKRGGRIVSNPLAGSIPRATDPLEDQHRAQALLQVIGLAPTVEGA